MKTEVTDSEKVIRASCQWILLKLIQDEYLCKMDLRIDIGFLLVKINFEKNWDIDYCTCYFQNTVHFCRIFERQIGIFSRAHVIGHGSVCVEKVPRSLAQEWKSENPEEDKSTPKVILKWGCIFQPKSVKVSENE